MSLPRCRSRLKQEQLQVCHAVLEPLDVAFNWLELCLPVCEDFTVGFDAGRVASPFAVVSRCFRLFLVLAKP